jgi:polyphosphate kinase
MHYVFLANLIGHFAADLFPGNEVLGHWSFRVTRNSELYIQEDDVAKMTPFGWRWTQPCRRTSVPVS